MLRLNRGGSEAIAGVAEVHPGTGDLDWPVGRELGLLKPHRTGNADRSS
jgi:hypothetical protein